MDLPIPIIWMSLLSFLGASKVSFHFCLILSGVFFSLFHFSMKIKVTNRIAPDGTPRFAASHPGLFRLPMSHKKDARLIWVKQELKALQKQQLSPVFLVIRFKLSQMQVLTEIMAIFRANDPVKMFRGEKKSLEFIYKRNK